MANDAKIRLEKLGASILTYSRNELYLSMRFLDYALSSLSYEMNVSTLSMGTDGEKIYFNPKFLFQTFDDNPIRINYAYLHMIMHGVYRHLYHEEEKDPEYWNLSCDMAVSYLLDSFSYPCLNVGVSSIKKKIYQELKSQLKVFTAEGIYHILMNKNLTYKEYEFLTYGFIVDDHSFWRTENKEKQAERPARNNTDSKRSNQKKKWQDISEKLSSSLELLPKEAGNHAGALQQYLKIANRESISYQSFLKKFAVFSEEIRLDSDSFDYGYYCFGMEHYKNMPFIEPLEYKESKKVEELALVLDTSGSCKTKLIQRFLEETYSILKSKDSFHHKMNLHIIQCDAQIQSDLIITKPEEFEAYVNNFQVKGMGGTDFRPAFAYVNQLVEQGVFHNLKGLLYFTDGYGKFPYKKPNYETAFLFVEEEQERKVPPWAMKLIINEESFPSSCYGS